MDLLERLAMLRGNAPAPAKKMGLGAKKAIEEAPTPAKKSGKAVAAPAPAPAKKVKAVPAPAPTNFKPESNYEAHGKLVDAKTARKIAKLLEDAGIEASGYFITCPDGEMRRMADDDGNGSIAFCYRAPIKNIYPKNHRGE
jgi:hypothetical protein